MPRMSSSGEALDAGTVAGGRGDGVGGADAERWFWEPRLWSPEGGGHRAEQGSARVARIAVLLGVLGLAAGVLGPRHHVGAGLDLAVAALALVGTVGSLVLGAWLLSGVPRWRRAPAGAVVALGLGSASMAYVVGGGVGALVSR